MAYKGKYPDRISAVSSALRNSGERFASMLIETNGGAHFKLERLHACAPIPKVGQEVEFWLYHVYPLNDLAGDTCMRYGVQL